MHTRYVGFASAVLPPGVAWRSPPQPGFAWARQPSRADATGTYCAPRRRSRSLAPAASCWSPSSWGNVGWVTASSDTFVFSDEESANPGDHAVVGGGGTGLGRGCYVSKVACLRGMVFIVVPSALMWGPASRAPFVAACVLILVVAENYAALRRGTTYYQARDGG